MPLSPFVSPRLQGLNLAPQVATIDHHARHSLAVSTSGTSRLGCG